VAECVAYLDRVAGKGAWVFAAPSPDSAAVPGMFSLICPEAAVLRLKWADIIDGVARIVAETRLEDRDARVWRQLNGQDFPWEGVV